MAKRKHYKNSDALRVFGWVADKVGTGYHRMHAPLAQLNLSPEWATKCEMWLESKNAFGDKYDLLIGQRTSTKEAFTLWKTLVHPSAPATIYEVDDWLFGVERENIVAYDFFSQPEVQDTMATAMYLADAMTVSCEPLKERLAPFNPNIYVIPNYLSERFLSAPERSTKAHEGVVVGYTGGSSHFTDIVANAVPIRQAMRKHPKAIFRSYGQDFTPIWAMSNYQQIPWQPSIPAYTDSISMDIGLCVLRDNDFNNCKTPIKALEYAFKGIPAIANNVTPYKEFIIHGETGFLVNTDEDWKLYLEELINNPDLRYEMGCNAFEQAQQWTLEGHIHERAAIFERVISTDRDVKEHKWELIAADLKRKNASKAFLSL